MSRLIVSIAQRPKYQYVNDRLTALNVSGEDAFAISLCFPDAMILVSDNVYKKAPHPLLTSDMCFNAYDEVILFTQKQNFFGGKMSRLQIDYLCQLCTYSGKISHYVNDPLFLNYNEVEETWRRLTSSKPIHGPDYPEIFGGMNRSTFANILGSNLEKGIIKNAYTIFPRLGADIHKMLPQATISFLDVIRKTHLSVRTYNPRQFEDRAGLLYVGIKRPDRMKKLREYSKVIPQFIMRGPVAGEKMISTVDTIQLYETSLANVVLGDEEHSDTGLNHRFLQGLASGSLTFVERSLDPNGLLLQDSSLRNFLYFDSARELESKYRLATADKETWEALIIKQNNELNAIYNEPENRLITRCSLTNRLQMSGGVI